MPEPAIPSELTRLFGDRRPTHWVTRERPMIDRIACPWLILRFIDPAARIQYVRTEQVLAFAARERAVAFDIPGAPFSHDGPLCSFDALIARFALRNPGLETLTPIVRGAYVDAFMGALLWDAANAALDEAAG